MKVYVLMFADETDPLGIFSSREKAIEFLGIDSYEEGAEDMDVWIKEYFLDQVS